MYLSQFDDPRESSSFRPDEEAIIDWGVEYRWKIWSLNFLRASSASRRKEFYSGDHRLPEFRPNAPLSDSGPRTHAWKGLLSLLRTAQPIKGCDVTVVLPHTSTTLLSVHRQIPTIPQLRILSERYSLNTLHCASVFSPRGIPYPMFRRLTADKVDGGWDYSPEGQSFHHYIACFGINPDSSIIKRKTDPNQTEHSEDDDNGSPYPAAMVSLAQRRVYDMTYPEDQGMYGPFLPASPAQATRLIPSTCLYVPDWAQLAAIRIYIQETILANSDLTSLAFLFQHHTLQPGFWGPPHNPVSGPAAEEQVAISVVDFERDWAGVEGVWRYCYPVNL